MRKARSTPRSAEQAFAAFGRLPFDTPPVERTGNRLVLYVREGCHLCDRFLVELEIELAGAAEPLLVDVDGDASLAARYGLRVPVLEIDGVAAGEGSFDRTRFRALFPL